VGALADGETDRSGIGPRVCLSAVQAHAVAGPTVAKAFKIGKEEA